MADRLRADVEDQITVGILNRIDFVSYKALPYAIGATGPKLGGRKKFSSLIYRR